MTKRLIPALLSCFIVTLFLVTAPPQAKLAGFGVNKVILEPVADTYIDSPEPDNNFGSSQYLRIYAGGRKALFRFDLSTVPALSTITSAKLSLTLSSTASDPPLEPKQFAVFDLARDFAENEATWSQYRAGKPWSSPGGSKFQDYFSLPFQSESLIVTDPGTYTLDVTQLIQQLRAKGQITANLVFFGIGQSNFVANITSRKGRDSSKHPKLEIQFSSTVPQVRAGPDMMLSQLKPITIDGTNSALPDGSSAGLTYLWTVEQPAPGSRLQRSQQLGTVPILTFNPDVPGFYKLRLSVTNALTKESSSSVVGITVGLNQHPRLHVNQALLAQLRGLKNTDNPTWTRFYNWVSQKPPYSDLNGGVSISYMLAYLVTGEKRFVDWTWDRLRPQIYKSGIDNKQGLKSLLDIYSNDSHTAAYIGGTFTAEVAIFYDWGYPELKDTQKSDLINWLNAANTYNYQFNENRKYYFRNDGATVPYGLAASALATYEDNPQAATQLSWFRQSWEELLKALDVMGKGGALAEGNAYGTAPTGQSLIYAANLVYYATGEDLFLSHPWFKARLAYDAFAAYPGTIGGPGSPVGAWPARPIIEQASVGGDGRRGYSWHSVNLRPNGLPLARRFAGTEEANLWNWVYRQPAVEQMEDYNSVADVLFYSPPPQLVKPTKLSHFDPSMGYVYIRSDWDSPDSTWIAFWAGPHLDTHEHLDQGAFAIFKRRDLAPKTGHYEWSGVSGEHGISYYTRTVSSNGLLIGDPSEVFRLFHLGKGCDEKGKGYQIRAPDQSGPLCIPNDGGQRTMDPSGMAVEMPEDYYLRRDTFDVAKVLSYNDDGQVVSVVADLTNAYSNARHHAPQNSAKVKKVYRRLIYLRPLDILILGDTVESVNPSFEKKWLIHSLDELQVPGTAQKLSPGEFVYTSTDTAKIVVDDREQSDKGQVTYDLRTGFSSLEIKTLFPNQFQYRKVGGRDLSPTIHEVLYFSDPNNQSNAYHFHRHIMDFWVKDYNEGVIPNHKSFNWPPWGPLETAAQAYFSTFIPGYGRWRLEVEPANKAATDYFLNVLRPSLNRADTLPAMKKLETGKTFGVELSANNKKYAVVFSKDGLETPVVTVSP